VRPVVECCLCVVAVDTWNCWGKSDCLLIDQYVYRMCTDMFKFIAGSVAVAERLREKAWRGIGASVTKFLFKFRSTFRSTFLSTFPLAHSNFT
jgi:hypothetical protein